MNRIINYRFFCIIILIIMVGACSLPSVTKTDERERIITPSSASVSPKMDFTKISTIAIFPLFPGGGPMMSGPGGMTMQNMQMMAAMQSSATIQDPTFAENLAQAISAELKTKQSQWNIVPPRDVLEAIVANDLGRGYKNFQADYNTASGQMGVLMLTAETREFFEQLSSALQVDAILMGNYGLFTTKQIVKTILGPREKTVYICNSNVALYFINSDKIWWTATCNFKSDNMDELTSAIGKSLASHVGKGTLRQL